MTKAGFSLIEVLVAVAITSIVGAMIVTLMGNMGNMATFYSAKEDYDSIYRTVQLLLLNENLCKFALRDGGGNGASFDPNKGDNRVVIDQIFVPISGSPTGGTPFLRVGDTFPPTPTGSPKGVTRLEVENMFLTEATDPLTGARTGRADTVVDVDGSGNPITLRTYTVNLNVQVKNTTGPAIQIKPIPLVIGLSEPTGVAGQIDSCFASTSYAAMCAVIHAQFDSATNRCIIPACDRASGVPGGGVSAGEPGCEPVVAGQTCTAPIYFLAYNSNATPSCRCVMSCTGPPGAQGVQGDPGMIVPFYTY